MNLKQRDYLICKQGALPNKLLTLSTGLTCGTIWILFRLESKQSIRITCLQLFNNNFPSGKVPCSEWMDYCQTQQPPPTGLTWKCTTDRADKINQSSSDPYPSENMNLQEKQIQELKFRYELYSNMKSRKNVTIF